MQPVLPGYPIVKLSGPLTVAVLLHWGLFGTLSVQLSFPNDRKFTKYLVYGVYIVEFVQTILVTHDTFSVFGSGFGDMDALTAMNFNWLTVPIMSAIVACVGQGFYAFRIFILSRSQIVPIFVSCLAVTSSAAAITTGIYALEAGSIIELNKKKISISIGIWCCTSALCDIVIAVCMTYYLMLNDTGYRRTRMLVTKLIRLTIETGSVTAVVALLNSILFFAFPHQTLYTIPALLMPKLYANTVYMVLNSRIRIIGGRDTYTSSTDMSVPTTILRDTSSPSPEDAEGRAPVVTITFNNDFSNDCEMGRMNEKPQGGGMSGTK
ncbi:hypothetical protein EV421DRAFT_1904957 [Armillaria borealis]|uniref:DUF6534 domain-containing protein n=1 Tax=Armillaria borealis TaxID=47425 RepID=A0AA39JEP4_9AGAR|nr:hypothetical protein EV421DRAFT_1904957 [Armillaria borealis]